MKKIMTLLLCFMIVLSAVSYADAGYEQKMIELHRLSDKSVQFLRDHSIDFTIFEGVEAYPEDHPVNHNATIESLIMQAGAYNFTDEQIYNYLKSSLNYKREIIGGKYDNTGRKRVIIPDCSLTVNEQKVESKEGLYPVICYNEIMYYPMTWHHSRLLGLATNWDRVSETLSIDKCDRENELPDYKGVYYDNSEEYLYADIARYDIIINGKKYDNTSEEYPVLTFRDITYFPLTYNLIANEFGWQYSYTAETGLIIK